MREILYIQAGNLANHIGTHFWNTQESYFTYGDLEDAEAEDPLVDHDKSFREGLSTNGQPTYCPRVLIFDRRANFGSLARTNDLYPEKDADMTPWSGEVVEFAQDPVPKSQYLRHLEEENEAHDDENDENATAKADPGIRFWSDYSHPYYVPRSIHKLPDPSAAESPETTNWASGQALFKQYDSDNSLMEESFRQFVEECDSLQGVQLTYDVPAFGGFIDSFLQTYRDDFSKLPALAFANLSSRITLYDSASRWTTTETTESPHVEAQSILNDALALQSLNEFTSIAVPIQNPALTWPKLKDEIVRKLETSNMHHTSTIISTHIETVTLPLRLKKKAEDFASFSESLNIQNDTRFSHLRGILPFTDEITSTVLENRFYDLSGLWPSEARQGKRTASFSRRDVLRGLSDSSIDVYAEWAGSNSALTSRFLPPFPIISSFPQTILSRRASNSRRPKIVSMPVMSSLDTNSATTNLLSLHAEYLRKNMHSSALLNVAQDNGLEQEQMKELVEELLSIRDAYAIENEDQTADDIGEDEE